MWNSVRGLSHSNKHKKRHFVPKAVFISYVCVCVCVFWMKMQDNTKIMQDILYVFEVSLYYSKYNNLI